MERIWSERHLVEKVIELNSIADAMQFVVSCREAGTSNILAALAFASTRPAADSNPNQWHCVAVPTWKSVWECCAQSVAGCGLDPSMLAYSGACIESKVNDGEISYMKFRAQDGFQFLSSLLNIAKHGREPAVKQHPLGTSSADLSAILVVHAFRNMQYNDIDEHMDASGEDKGLALALLADGRFALFSWNADEFHDEVTAGAAVYIERTIPALFHLVSETSGEDCYWMYVDNWLTLSCARDVDRLVPLRSSFPNWHTFPYTGYRGASWLSQDSDRVAQLAELLEAHWNMVRTSPISPHPLIQLSKPIMDPMDDMESVIETLVHDESPAVVDPELSELQANVQWAEHVEGRIRHDAVSNSQQPVQSSPKIHLLSFRSGKGELFRKMLLQDKEFKPLRKALEDARCPLVLQPSGTIVLVWPHQYLQVVNSSALRSRTLKRYEVVIVESEEYLMNEVLLRLASRQRPRENRSERLEVDLYSFAVNFHIKRTFICQAPLLLAANTVAQSTTEAVRSTSSASSRPNYFASVRGQNPRRSTVCTWGESP